MSSVLHCMHLGTKETCLSGEVLLRKSNKSRVFNETRKTRPTGLLPALK